MIRASTVWGAAFGAVIAVSSPARADDVTLPNTKAKLTVTPSWHALTSTTTGVVAAYKSDRGGILAVTRAQVPNAAAWRSKTRDAYADQVELGLAEQVPGYKRTAKKVSVIHEVPTLDVEARSRDGRVVVFRVLLFRTYALALAIEVPAGEDVADARSIAARFATPAPTTPAP